MTMTMKWLRSICGVRKNLRPPLPRAVCWVGGKRLLRVISLFQQQNGHDIVDLVKHSVRVLLPAKRGDRRFSPGFATLRRFLPSIGSSITQVQSACLFLICVSSFLPFSHPWYSASAAKVRMDPGNSHATAASSEETDAGNHDFPGNRS